MPSYLSFLHLLQRQQLLVLFFFVVCSLSPAIARAWCSSFLNKKLFLSILCSFAIVVIAHLFCSLFILTINCQCSSFLNKKLLFFILCSFAIVVATIFFKIKSSSLLSFVHLQQLLLFLFLVVCTFSTIANVVPFFYPLFICSYYYSSFLSFVHSHQ